VKLIKVWLYAVILISFFVIFYLIYAVDYTPDPGFMIGFYEGLVDRFRSPETGVYTANEAGRAIGPIFLNLFFCSLMIFSISKKKKGLTRIFSCFLLWLSFSVIGLFSSFVHLLIVLYLHTSKSKKYFSSEE
jgi:hypothetical protein